jgi:hypothetical protein
LRITFALNSPIARAPARAVPTAAASVGGAAQRSQLAGKLFGRCADEDIEEERYQRALYETCRNHAGDEIDSAPVTSNHGC